MIVIIMTIARLRDHLIQRGTSILPSIVKISSGVVPCVSDKMRFILPLLLLSSCGHYSYEKEIKRKVLEEKVSINTLLMHSHAAYLRGCLTEKHRIGRKGEYQKCRELADQYVKEEILPFIQTESDNE